MQPRQNIEQSGVICRFPTFLGVRITQNGSLGTGIFSEIGAAVADFLGNEADLFSNKLEAAKSSALEKLINKSISIGGNAVIGVDLDYINFSGNMIGVVANGTSVKIEKDS